MVKKQLLLLSLILFFVISSQTESNQEEKLYGSQTEKIFNGEIDPIDKMVQDALEAKAFELTSKNDNKKIYFGQVLSCKTQTVSGTNYEMKIEFFEENSDKIHTYFAKLHVVPWEKYVDFIQFEEIQSRNHETNSEEQILHSLENFVVKSVYEKFKDQDISQYINVVDFRVTDKQVVSGIKYKTRLLLYSPFININNKAGKMKGFTVTVVHQAWLDKFEIIEIQNYEYSEEEIQQIQLEKQLNENKSGSWKKYEFEQKDDQIFKVVSDQIRQELQNRQIQNLDFEILSTEIQVVSGYNIRVHFLINNEEQGQEFEAIIYYQPWSDLKYILSFEKIQSQFPETNMKSHVGGWTKYDIQTLQNEESEQKIWKLINKTIKNYLGQQGLTSSYELISVEKQVVSGLKIKAVLDIEKEHYVAYILLQPWNENYELLSFEKMPKLQIQEEL